VHQTFTELAVEGASPDEVVQQIGRMSGCPVVLENLAHQVLTYSQAGADASDLLDGWEGYAWPGEALRFNMLRTHYRQPLDWTAEGLDAAHKTLWDWYGAVEGAKTAATLPQGAIEALADDLNTPAMIAELHKLFHEKRFAELGAGLAWLGFSGRRRALFRGSAASGNVSEIELLVAKRLAARKAKNWAEADRIRDELAKKGIELRDAKNPETGEIETIWEESR
jgi:cysteinyl-tRNA synthetase